MYSGLVSSTDYADSERVKCIGFDLGDLNKDNLLICSPTVLAFSLSDKFWGEAVTDLIHETLIDTLI